MSSSSPLRVSFRNSVEYADEFDKNLVNRGLFVATAEPAAIRDIVDFVVVVPFSRREIPGRGEVTYTIDAQQAAQAGGSPGLGLHILELDMKAAAEAREVIRETLSGLGPTEKRSAPRIPARLRVRYRTRHELSSGVIRDISLGGLYLPTERPDPVGTVIQLALVRPVDGKEVVLPGEVARTPLMTGEAGTKAGGMGIRFLAMDDARLAEVKRFVRCMDLHRRAQTGAEVRGRVDETGVETLVHLFCYTNREGELLLGRGKETGRIEFKACKVVRAELPLCGLGGKRAFYRMMTWRDGEFEYRHRSVDASGGVNQPGERLVREWLSLRAEVTNWIRKIPPESRIAPGRAYHTISQAVRPALAILDRRPTVAAALGRLGSTDVVAYRFLGQLHARGIVTFESAHPIG